MAKTDQPGLKWGGGDARPGHHQREPAEEGAGVDEAARDPPPEDPRPDRSRIAGREHPAGRLRREPESIREECEEKRTVDRLQAHP